MNARIGIRVDASPQIGTGHLSRCLVLADKLEGRGAKVTFISDVSLGALAEDILRKGHHVKLLAKSPIVSSGNIASWQLDAEETLHATSDGCAENWLVVDHYSLDAMWETEARRHSGKVAVIDDLANRKHHCEVLIDQNLTARPERRYRGLVSRECIQLVGVRYLMLRPEFLVLGKHLRRNKKPIEGVLVSFGGSDPSNETAKAVLALQKVKRPDTRVDIIVGPHYGQASALEDLCQNMDHAHLHYYPDNVAALMCAADIAIGAIGTSTWERCYLGLPTLAWALNRRQLEFSNYLDGLGLIKNLGLWSNVTMDAVASALIEWMQDPERTFQMSQRCFAHFARDIDGAQAIVDVLLRDTHCG